MLESIFKKNNKNENGKKVCEELKRIERLVMDKKKRKNKKSGPNPAYGNLLTLNTNRLILDSVGESILLAIIKKR